MKGYIFIGDCIEIMDKLDFQVDCIVTDPPYNIAVDADVSERIGMFRLSSKNTVINSSWDRFTDEDFYKFNLKWVKLAYDKLRNGGAFYIFNSCYNIGLIQNIVKELGLDLQLRNIIIWYKRNAPLGFPNKYCNSYEPCFYFIKSGSNQVFNKSKNGIDRDVLDITLTSNSEREQGNYHPTCKPVKLFDVLINKSTNAGDWVLDPFLGSGTTGRSCQLLNRNFIGVERNVEYISGIKKRLQLNQNILFGNQDISVYSMDTLETLYNERSIVCPRCSEIIASKKINNNNAFDCKCGFYKIDKIHDKVIFNG
jgi:site-specific DNA-methyltransferase (adenine-specific)